MYREQIDNFIDSKKEEMLEDLKSLVRINSQRGEASPGKPFGDGPAEALAKGQELMEQYGLKTRNYENYAVAGDYGNGEKALDILLSHPLLGDSTDRITITLQPELVVRSSTAAPQK